MNPLITTIGSIIALITSALAAWGSWVKVNSDRRRGVGEEEMSRSRFGLDALKAALDSKDILIGQYKDEIARLRIQVHDLQVELDRLKRKRPKAN